jgi:transposase-like protein
VPAASIKATYSLDPATIRSLERIARRWDVSKSEALRRAIRSAESADAGASRSDAVAALDELQERLALDEASAEHWSRSIRVERTALSRRLEE